MRPTHKQCNDFLAHRPLPGVAFEHDDVVEIVAGEYVGKLGNVGSAVARISKAHPGPSNQIVATHS